MSKKSVKELWSELADKLLAEIAAGRPPWVRPWAKLGGRSGTGFLPVSGASGRSYRGVNILLLWMAMEERGWKDTRFYTFQQALKLGTPENPVAVRKGEAGEPVYFYNRTVQLPNPLKGKIWWTAGHPELKKAYPGGLPEGSKIIPLLKSFIVFNRQQIDGLPVEEKAEETPVQGDLLPVPPTYPKADALLEELATVVPMRTGGDRACYSPGLDLIAMPDRKVFVNDAAYIATALHEYCHASGHPSRLARDMSGAFGTLPYALEELCAESGAAFTLAALGMEYQSQHADYLASWAQKLQEMPEKERSQKLMASFTAGQKAADLVLAGLKPAETKATAQSEESDLSMAA